MERAADIGGPFVLLPAGWPSAPPSLLSSAVSAGDYLRLVGQGNIQDVPATIDVAIDTVG